MFNLKNPVDLVFGAGSLNQLGSKVGGLGQKALIVTGTSSEGLKVSSTRKAGTLDRVVQLLADVDIEAVLFEKVTPNPLASTVTEGVKLAVDTGCDFVIGIGGGSPIDAAKAIAVMAVNPGLITDYQPGGKFARVIPQKALPIVAITTTAGTGTEINRYFVITNDATHEKPGLGYACAYPSVSFVDPELMLSLPVESTIDTGLDVLFHAMESFVAKDATKFSDLLAEEAMDLVLDNIQRAARDGNDLTTRTNMAWANTLAGWAIDIAGTVGIHSLAHPISGHFNTTHAKSLSALGPAYLDYNYTANIPKYAQLAEILGLHDHDFELPDAEKAARVGQLLHHILAVLGRAYSIKDFGVTEKDLDTLVRDTLATMSGGLKNNIKPLSADDLKAIYLNSMAYQPVAHSCDCH
ncbi:MAG: alcohol dehydrogenase, class [Firmicutes bacterium]|nr:alcohol dehydrogenase, class [Bacillota bacterium]